MDRHIYKISQILTLHFVFLLMYGYRGCLRITDVTHEYLDLSKTKHVPKEDSQPFLSLCFELDQTWARVHNRQLDINFTRM